MTRRSCIRSISSVLCAALLAACTGEHGSAVDQAAAGQLQQTRGEWLLINYWAEWCKPCIEEIPELNRLHDRHGDSVRVLAVNFDGVRGADLEQQAARLGFAVPQLEEDPSTHYGFSRPQVLPTTVLIAPSGEVSDILIGPQTLESLINAVGIKAAAGAGKG